MNICVVGTGYVGLVTGTCLAEIGHRVVCLDNDEEKIRVLHSGGMPIFEPHLEELVRDNRQRGRLSFTSDFSQANDGSEAVFICVGTPPLESGEADLSAVEKVTREVACRTKAYKLVIEKSTVPVQTGEHIFRTLRMYCRGEGGDFDVASNPEFPAKDRPSKTSSTRTEVSSEWTTPGRKTSCGRSIGLSWKRIFAARSIPPALRPSRPISW
jgi:UDPglucose 6-dehydrogenase